jgi:hypothetical protein
LFIARGLWDYAEALEGSFESFKRATGLKEIVVVRGPHGENEWGAENISYVRQRMVDFARRAVLNERSVGRVPAPTNLKELVASAPMTWEASSAPDDTEQKQAALP